MTNFENTRFEKHNLITDISIDYLYYENTVRADNTKVAPLNGNYRPGDGQNTDKPGYSGYIPGAVTEQPTQTGTVAQSGSTGQNDYRPGSPVKIAQGVASGEAGTATQTEVIDTLKKYNQIDDNTKVGLLENGKVLIQSKDNTGFGYVAEMYENNGKEFMRLSVVRIGSDGSLTYVQGDNSGMKQSAILNKYGYDVAVYDPTNKSVDTMTGQGCVLTSNAIYINFTQGENLTPLDSLGNAFTTKSLNLSKGMNLARNDDYVATYADSHYQQLKVGDVLADGSHYSLNNLDQDLSGRVFNGQATMARVGGAHTVVVSGMDIDMSSGKVAQYNISDPGRNISQPIINNVYHGVGTYNLTGISYYK